LDAKLAGKTLELLLDALLPLSVHDKLELDIVCVHELGQLRPVGCRVAARGVEKHAVVFLDEEVHLCAHVSPA
jgi:hypothetical protein